MLQAQSKVQDLLGNAARATCLLGEIPAATPAQMPGTLAQQQMPLVL